METSTENARVDEKGRGRRPGCDEIRVKVFAPRTPKPKRFRWPLTKTVGEAADEAAKAFEYEAGSPTFQNDDDEVLDRGQTLKAAGVEDKDKLELVDVGGGV